MPDNLAIGIGADTSKLRADLAVAQAQVRQFGKDLRDAASESLRTGDDAGIRNIATGYERARGRVTELGTALRQAHGVVRDAALFTSGIKNVGALAQGFREFGGTVRDMADKVFPHFREVFGLTIAAAGLELGKMIGDSASSVKGLENLAAAIGISTDTLEAFRLAMAKSGIDEETADRSLERFAKTISGARENQAKLKGEVVDGSTALRGSAEAAAEASRTHALFAAKLGAGQAGMQGMATVLRGGRQQIRDFSDPFVALGIEVSRFPQTAAGTIALLQEWAQRLSSLTSAEDRNRIASQVLGRNWAAQLPGLLNLTAGMKDAEHQIEQSNTGIGKTTKQQADAFTATVAEFRGTFGRLKDIVLNEFGAAILPVFSGLNAVIGDNADSIRAWSRSAAEGVKAFAFDMAAAFRGAKSEELTTGLGRTIVDTFRSLRDDILPTLVSAFNGLLSVFDGIAGAINDAFGTKLSGGALLAIAIFGQLSGLFSVLITGAGLLAAGIAALATPVGFAVAAAVLLGTTIAQNWQVISDAFTTGSAYIRSIFIGALDAISTAATAVFDYIAAKIKSALDAISSLGDLFGGGGADQPIATAPIPRARGGLTPGPLGTDTVPAWLTPGEFVHTAGATSYYGTGVMRALNSRLIPREAFSSLGFAMGGLVDRLHSARPIRLSSGGQVAAVGGRVAVDLTLNGEQFSDLMSPPRVAAKLVRFANTARLRSAGLKPSWQT